MRRYIRDQRIRGKKLESAETVVRLRRARDLGLIKTRDVILKESQRLDHLAFQHLGSAGLWWVLAAFSDIGWGMQAPPGTIVKIPLDMNAVSIIAG